MASLLVTWRAERINMWTLQGRAKVEDASCSQIYDDGPYARNSGCLLFETRNKAGRSGLPKYRAYRRVSGCFTSLGAPQEEGARSTGKPEDGR